MKPHQVNAIKYSIGAWFLMLVVSYAFTFFPIDAKFNIERLPVFIFFLGAVLAFQVWFSADINAAFKQADFSFALSTIAMAAFVSAIGFVIYQAERNPDTGLFSVGLSAALYAGGLILSMFSVLISTWAMKGTGDPSVESRLFSLGAATLVFLLYLFAMAFFGGS